MGTLGVGLSAAGLASWAKGTLDAADDIATAADQANVAVERFQTLQGAFRALEIDADQFDKILKRLISTQGDVASGVESEATRALDKLGVSARVVSGEIETTDELLDAIASGLGKVVDPAQRAALAADIVGQQLGPQLAAAIGDGGAALRQAEENFRSVGNVIEAEMITKLADANETWDRTLEAMSRRSIIFAADTIDAFEKVRLWFAKEIRGSEAPWIDAEGAEAYIQASLNRETARVNARLGGLKLKALDWLNPDPLPRTPAAIERESAKSSRATAAGKKTEDDIEKAYKAQIESMQRQIELQEAKLMGRENEVKLAHDLLDIEAQFTGKISKDKIDALKAVTIEYADQKRIAQEIKDLDDGAENALKVHKAAKKALEDQYREQAEMAQREFDNLADIYERAFRDGTGSIWDTFKSMGKRAIAELLAAWTLGGTGGAGTLLGSLGLGDLLPGGGAGGGGLLSLLGGGSKGLVQTNPGDWGGTPPWAGWPMGGGTTAGGAGAGGVGAAAGPMLGAFAIGSGIGSLQKSVGLGGSSLGGGLGAAAGMAMGGPIGAAIGAVVGSTLGGVLKGVLSPNRTSNAVITGMGTATTGGKGGKQDVALGLAGNVQDGLSQIADALGVDVGSFYTAIGVRGGDYRVNTSGSSLKIKNGAKNFGDDAEAAVEYALRDAIGDGAFSGKISAAAERALKNTSKSIEDAIEDALTIESISKRLREIEDPIGAAVDKVVEDFTKLRDTLVANGATAQQLADAEKLFNYEREAALERTESTLRDFLDSLKIGGNSPLSLREQSATAEAAFAKYEADIAAGKTVDQSGYVEAAQAALDVKRQTDGSTQGYFDLYNRVVSAGNAAQAGFDSAAANRNDTNPFAKPTAEATATTANNTATLPAILNRLGEIADHLTRMGGGALYGVSGGLGFQRGY